jgi:hypothetical protein
MTPPPTPPQDKPPPGHEARIAALEAAVNETHQRLNDGSATMKQLQADLKTNTDTTASIKSDTSEIIDFFASAKGAFRVLNWIGNLAKPIGAIVALGVAGWSAWTAFKSGGPPA